MKSLIRFLPTILSAIALTGASWAAEDPPAVRQAPAAQKDALRANIAAAVIEGEVSYWDQVITSKTHNALVAAFRQQYGLPASFKVNYSVATSTNLITRVDQEMASGRVTMDIVASSSLPWVYDRIRANQVMRYESPQYAHYQTAFERGLGKEGYFAFNCAYFFAPMWSSERLDFKGTSWKDVIGAVPEGRLSVGDGAKSQTYLATYLGLQSVLGEDYLKSVAKMKPVLALRSEQVASQLVTGQMLMTLSGMPSRAYQMNQNGAKLKFLLPKEGVVLLPQAIFILAKAPHPASAKLWLDFMLSEVGQKIMIEHEATISGRSGMASVIPEYAPSIDSLSIIKMDWEKVTPQDMEKARLRWTETFGNS